VNHRVPLEQFGQQPLKQEMYEMLIILSF